MRNEEKQKSGKFFTRGARLTFGQGTNGLPNPELVSYYELENDRKYYMDCEIDEDVMELHRLILRWNMEDAGIPREERKPIRIYIDSPGGDVGTMWLIIDAMTTSDTPVYTINMGNAASAASLIFMAGEKRYMMPHARVLIHEGSAMMAGDTVKVLDASDSYRRTIRQMKDFILSHTRIPAATLSKQKNHDWELDAEYCMQHGVCDEIVQRMSEII